MSIFSKVWLAISSWWLLALVILFVLTFAAPKMVMLAAYIFIGLGYGNDLNDRFSHDFR